MGVAHDLERSAILALPRPLPKWQAREAEALLKTAGYRVAARLTYRRLGSRLMSRFKLEELERLAREYEDAKIVVFDDVKPGDYFEIARRTGREVIDRTMLILEIFALHAGSREAKLQIEMAQLKHKLPLIREAIRSSKLRELPGFLGPGGYAIDAYYRYVVQRIARIRRELEEIRKRRMEWREKRKRAGLPHVAIVGYASAGKTTLFNRLVHETKPVGPEYFTTLAPKAKARLLDGNLRAVFVDTVGFIYNIPPEVVEAFKATLEEATYADALLFVVDVSEPEAVIRSKVVEGLETLHRIGAVGKPLLVVANKVDLVTRSILEERMELLEDLVPRYYDAYRGIYPVSAAKGVGVGELTCRVATLLRGTVRSTYSA